MAVVGTVGSGKVRVFDGRAFSNGRIFVLCDGTSFSCTLKLQICRGSFASHLLLAFDMGIMGSKL